MPAPPIGGVGDAIGAGWAIGGEEAREGSGDGEATGVGPLVRTLQSTFSYFR